MQPKADCEVLRLKLAYYEKLMWLAAREVVFFSPYNSKVQVWDGWFYPFVLCNDIFGYAAADAEPLEPNEIDVLKRVFEQYNWDGVAT